MAIEGIIGTVGSGKSVLLNKRMIDKAVAGRELALNYEYNEQGLYLALRRRGMTHRAAMDKINNIIVIRTYEQLRGLKNRWLGLDEAHFWFFSRMWERIQLADVQFWSLSRKLGVDVSLVTQRWAAIDSVVRDLAVDVWHARPLVSREVRQFPFNVATSLWNATQPRNQWLGMFMYTKIQDNMGGTKDSRKGIIGATAYKSICTLDHWSGRAYDTGRFFTSPLIEEDARRQRVDYLRKVYLGELVPLQTCPCCGGLGTAVFAFRDEDFSGGVWRPNVLARVDDRAAELVARSACPVCGGSGYFSDPSGEDIAESRSAAFKGLLGPEIRAAEVARLALPEGAPTPVIAKKRGGWAAKHG